MIRIDYLNKDRQVRHSFVRLDEPEVGFEIVTIIKQGATDIHIYNLDPIEGTNSTQEKN